MRRGSTCGDAYKCLGPSGPLTRCLRASASPRQPRPWANGSRRGWRCLASSSSQRKLSSLTSLSHQLRNTLWPFTHCFTPSKENPQRLHSVAPIPVAASIHRDCQSSEPSSGPISPIVLHSVALPRLPSTVYAKMSHQGPYDPHPADAGQHAAQPGADRVKKIQEVCSCFKIPRLA